MWTWYSETNPFDEVKVERESRLLESGGLSRREQVGLCHIALDYNSTSMANLAEQIAALLPNGLGARGDEERNPLTYPSRSLHVLLATSGSVASIKAPLIVRELLKVRICVLELPEQRSPALAVVQHEQVDVQLVATKASLHFFDWKALEEEHAGRVKVWTDAEEWKVSPAAGFALRLSR